MSKPHYTAADIRDQKIMLRLWQERGPQTQSDLDRAGISRTSQEKNLPEVRRLIAEADALAA